MERFYSFANWMYQNWVPITAGPLLLLGLGVLTFQYLTEKPYEERMADRLSDLRTSRELADELKSLPLSDATRTVELNDWTSAKEFIFLTGVYETTLSNDEFLNVYSGALQRDHWLFVRKEVERGLETTVFRRSGIELNLTFHPAGILSSTDRGIWKVLVQKH
jgi:hypothetical protein